MIDREGELRTDREERKIELKKIQNGDNRREE